MTVRPEPSWPLPVVALAQIWLAVAFVSPLKEPGAPWDLGYAALAAVGSMVGLALLALALRSCARLWRLPDFDASWPLVTSASGVALLAALFASGPVSSGAWRWWSPVLAGFAAFLVIAAGREVRRRLARDVRPRSSHAA